MFALPDAFSTAVITRVQGTFIEQAPGCRSGFSLASLSSSMAKVTARGRKAKVLGHMKQVELASWKEMQSCPL